MKNIPRVELFGIPVSNLSMQETLHVIDQAIGKKEPVHHVVINAGKIVAMQSDPQLRESVLSADLINADGISVVWASKILGKPLKERVPGIDLMQNLLELAKEKKYKVYFLGARQEVLDKMLEKVRKKYGSEIVAGYANGYFNETESTEVAQKIADSGADILFVGISSPKKEIFLNQNKEILKKVPFIMGVGGSFDVLAGKTKRAPVWMQKAGLEWFFRLIQEPRRMWKRYLIGNLKFVLLLIKSLFNFNEK